MSKVIFTQRTKIRSGPGYDGETLEIAPEGSVATILDQEIALVDGLQWFYLQHATQTIGYSARKYGETELFTVEKGTFHELVEFTLRFEGGYSNDPNDPGGETHWGISKRSYPTLDIKNLTRDQAIEIYYEDYWLPSRAYTYTYPKNLILFDVAVLSGVSISLALRNLDPLSILAHRYDFYAGLRNFEIYGRGWIKRNTALLRLLRE